MTTFDPNTMTNEQFDIAVIGAGSGGFSAAISAADQGARVALIGHGMIGGTCVNVGCVPSKTMIRAMESLHQARSASRFDGLRATAQVIDWSALKAQKDELVEQLRQGKYIDLLPAYDNITYMEGQARLDGQGVMVGDTPLDAAKIIIATGSRARAPDIAGIDTVPYLTSTEALDLETLPKSLLVIGGGYIGCELAQMFCRAGVAVTVVCRSRLLPEAEPEVSTALTGYLKDEGITIHDGVSYQRIYSHEDGIALDLQNTTIEAEQILVTTGRRANTDGLGLLKAGIELLPNGGIKVDAQMQTTREGVFAAGDVTGRDQFVYMAAYGAKVAARNALSAGSMIYDNTAMPWVVFTDPQAAGVGLSEATARQQGYGVKTSTLALSNVPRALAARDTRGVIKLVADVQTNKLLGAQILAPEGVDSIQTAVLALKYGLTVSDLAETIFPYLSTVEGLKLAAQTFDKDVSKLSCCAG